MTSGREDNVEGSATAAKDAPKEKGAEAVKGSEKYAKMAQVVFDTIGKDNLVSIDNCATRLRLVVKDNTQFPDAPIKAAGAFGIKRLGQEAVQIVIGPDVEHVANQLKIIAKMA
ncbi:hypothetical protein Zmor_019114 [Zophobas morio]|uniref:PTS EIIB type-1 domain-containing protein n=1 Tax=Zophobas morio TaxID=2755281 RepID=A0AA38M0S7_9CUCU|nr:hypothetical protein Zmor_019114 [Zophobas morio]